MKQIWYEWFFSYKYTDGGGHCFVTLNSNKPSRKLLGVAAEKIKEITNGIDAAIVFYDCLGVADSEDTEE
jgi:hypothetical protein